jgi:hypothetical protein
MHGQESGTAARARTAGRQRAAPLLATLVFVLAVGCLAGCTNGGTTPPRPTASGPAPATSPHPSRPGRITIRLGLTQPGEPFAIAMAGQHLWLTLAAPPVAGGPPQPGRLVELDAATGALQAAWPVGGAPVAVVATAGKVWVANTSGDSRPPAVDADTVVELDTAGHFLHRYHVPDPLALATADHSVWVLSSLPTAARLTRLHDGITDTPVMLAGTAAATAQALVGCSDALYAATIGAGGTLEVSRLTHDGSLTARTQLGVGGLPLLACDPPGVALAVDNAEEGGLSHLTFAPGSPPAPAGPRTAAALAGSQPLWILVNQAGPGTHPQLNPVDPANLAIGQPVALPEGDAHLAAASGGRAWTVVNRQLIEATLAS